RQDDGLGLAGKRRRERAVAPGSRGEADRVDAFDRRGDLGDRGPRIGRDDDVRGRPVPADVGELDLHAAGPCESLIRNPPTTNPTLAATTATTTVRGRRNVSTPVDTSSPNVPAASP